MEPFRPLYEHFGFRVKDLRAIGTEPDDPVPSPHVYFGEVGQDEVSLEIPSFQRGLRWSMGKRKDFLLSLRQGRPVGTLVLARKEKVPKKGKRPARQKWYVIDGQQRIHALNIILSNYWTDGFFDLTSLSAELDELATALGIDNKNEIETVLIELASTPDFEEKYLEETKDLSAELAHRLDVDEKVAQGSTVEKILRKIRLKLAQQLTSLEDVELSTHLVILPDNSFTAIERRIAITEIFAAVNSGVKLDKNDLLAALWDQYKVCWPPVDLPKSWKKALLTSMFDDMKNRISNSYIDEGDFDTEVEELIEENVSFYDFVYALRQVTLMDPTKPEATRPRRVFVAKGHADKIDSDLALQVLSLFLTGGVKGSDKLATDHLAGGSTFSRDTDGRLLVGQCLCAYNDAVKAVEKVLLPYFQLNTTTANTKMVGKTEATTYLGNFLAIGYSKDFSKRSDKLKWGAEPMSASSLKKAWTHHLTAWWLYDVLENELTGSTAMGEAQALTWNDYDNDEPNLRICSPPNVSDFRGLFETVFYTGANRGTYLPQRPRVPKSAVALMRLVYANYPLGNNPLDFDHLVPYKKFGNPPTFPKNREPLRLNHPANWMPVASQHNRGRGNNSWADHINKIPNLREKSNIEDRLFLPVAEFNNGVRDSNEKFLTLMARRWAMLFRTAMDTLDLEEWKRSSDEQLVVLEDLTTNIVERLARNGVAELEVDECSVLDIVGTEA